MPLPTEDESKLKPLTPFFRKPTPNIPATKTAAPPPNVRSADSASTAVDPDTELFAHIAADNSANNQLGTARQPHS